MKYTVITGASSGIGYETALAFAERGKNLIIAARRADKLEEVKADVAKMNPNLEVIIREIDLADAANAYKLYESLQEYDIETWINNAGFGNYAAIGEQDLNKIQSMLHLNIESLTILTSLFVRDYADKEGTQIINISSRGGYTVVADAVAYCATKFYVSALTEGLAQELQDKGAKMQAKVLAPAATETEFAGRAREEENFDYNNLPKFHTAKEMAGFMLDLYDSPHTVGIVDAETYEFQLKGPIYPYAGPKK